MNPSFWSGRRVFLTGHTGFKGSWLSLWLRVLGARVTGLALPPPTDPSLFELAQVEQDLRSVIGDVRDLDQIRSVMTTDSPEVVIHMAAQPLVRISYADPILTYSTNVMGTVNVLEAVRECRSVRAILIVTTDKVYEPCASRNGHTETDRLGGHDPYSSSKACVEILIDAWRRSYFAADSEAAVGLASARAGNVLGGGDWASDRLIPDLVRGALQGTEVPIRYPSAVRPWQHVLDPLGGYLALVEQLWSSPIVASGAWNFGPSAAAEHTVKWIADKFARTWGEGARWRDESKPHPHEDSELKLDASKAKRELGWRPHLSADQTLEWTVEWYKAYARQESLRDVTLSQIRRYMA